MSETEPRRVAEIHSCHAHIYCDPPTRAQLQSACASAELSGVAGAAQVHQVHAGGGPGSECSAATLGLTVAEAKAVLAGLQRNLVQAQDRLTVLNGVSGLCSGSDHARAA